MSESIATMVFLLAIPVIVFYLSYEEKKKGGKLNFIFSSVLYVLGIWSFLGAFIYGAVLSANTDWSVWLEVAIGLYIALAFIYTVLYVIYVVIETTSQTLSQKKMPNGVFKKGWR